MNVLLIAPDLGLAGAANEVRAVSMALNATVYNGTVNRKDVLDALQAREWDAIWLATHGNESGVMLSDGPLPTGDLTAIVRNTAAHLLVLNSCSSWAVARNIHYDLDRRIDIVCTQAAADDLSAYQTGTFLARNLSQGMSTFDAYERSKPGGNTLYFIFRRDDNRGDDNEAALLALLRTEFEKMYRAIDANKRDIVKQVNTLEKRFDQSVEQLKADSISADKRIFAIEYAATVRQEAAVQVATAAQDAAVQVATAAQEAAARVDTAAQAAAAQVAAAVQVAAAAHTAAAQVAAAAQTVAATAQDALQAARRQPINVSAKMLAFIVLAVMALVLVQISLFAYLGNLPHG